MFFSFNMRSDVTYRQVIVAAFRCIGAAKPMWCSLDNTKDHRPDYLRTHPASVHERISPTANFIT